MVSAHAVSAQSIEETSIAKVHLRNIDYVQLHVGNAYQSMHFLRTMFGFTPLAYAGLETGVRDCVSYVLGQGSIRIIVSSSLDPASSMADEVRLHGDAVKEIAFRVDNAAETFHLALLRGASPVAEPVVQEDPAGTVVRASIKAYGNIIHSFIQRENDHGSFLPGYRVLAVADMAEPHLLELDHVALSVAPGELDRTIEFYVNTLDLQITHEENIVTQYSAMNSKVVQNSTGTVRFPTMEPGPSQRKSQIEEFVKYNNGPGVQHLAFSCKDISESAHRFRSAGVEFLSTPGAYYDVLSARVGQLKRDVTVLRDLNILVDRDEWGYLLQIFSKPITARPTLFFELIQREGARGFGSGNIRALFDAVEREQKMRGNL